jgi:hypothetical protein
MDPGHGICRMRVELQDRGGSAGDSTTTRPSYPGRSRLLAIAARSFDLKYM